MVDQNKEKISEMNKVLTSISNLESEGHCSYLRFRVPHLDLTVGGILGEEDLCFISKHYIEKVDLGEAKRRFKKFLGEEVGLILLYNTNSLGSQEELVRAF